MTAMPDGAFVWRHVATHVMGSRSLCIYRDDARSVTRLVATNGRGYGTLGERPCRVCYYADPLDDFSGPDGPYHTEQALVDALKARGEGAGQGEFGI